MYGRLGLFALIIAVGVWWYIGYTAWERIVRKKGPFTLLDAALGFFVGLAGPILLLCLLEDASECILEEQLPSKKDKEESKTDEGEKGFTLIELMIVVAIISILAATAIPAYKAYRDKLQAATPVTQEQIEQIDKNVASPLD